MAGIPDEKIDEVRSASDLVEVVSDYVRLRKQGGRFVGLCPFHNEKSPSFSVDPKNNLYHCFGCKAGGDVFTFIREKEGVGFLDAIRLLADRAGVVLPEEEAPSPEASEKEGIYAALRFAARFYFEQLGTDAGKRAREYLSGRGFTRESVKTFGIGYAPDSWDALLNAATRAGHRPEILERAGLVRARQGGDGHYDAFRDRIQFPIFSAVGKILGFGGRILPGGRPMPDGTEPAKYINTSETPVYHKAEVLYGLKQAKTAIRALEEAILVEGYADVVALHEAGVQNVVAASGTALTVQQVKLIKSLARTVVLLYDADNAGQMAAARGIHTALDGGLGVYLLTLPSGADPDSFVRQFGGEAFTNLLKDERHDFVQFLADGARRTGRLDTPEGKAAAAGEIVDAVARVKDPVAQDAYLLRAATALSVPDATLRPLLRDRLSGGGRQAPLAPPEARRGDAPEDRPAAPVIPLVVMKPEERLLLRLMLQHGTPMVEHILGRMSVDEFSGGPVRGLVEALILQFERGAVSAATLLQGDAGEDVKRLAAEVLAERYSISDNWRKLGVAVPDQDGKPMDAATSAMRLLKLDRLEEAVAAVRYHLETTEQAGGDTTLLNTELMALNELRRQITRNEFLEWNAS